MTAEERMVIFASSLGTVFEWYDFYIYGTLAPILAAQFFAGVNPSAAFIFTLLAFAAGFAVRPFGALFFGRLGDLIGRKYTFLITMTLMGLGTFAIGLLPNYAAWGIAAPITLICLRLFQGLALGGEYGGAAIYVAEHSPKNKRGFYTSWIQTTATVGLFMALLIVLGIRTWMGETEFAGHGSLTDGWRIPFLLSAILLGVSIWIRLRLNESPVFLRMKAEGRGSKRPLTEAFGQWANLKIAILALLGATAGEAVVWYGGQFYALFFLTQTLKVPAVTAQILIAVGLLIGTPFFILFGWLSDKVGRKPIILAGFLLAALTYFPIFKAITHYANPALEAALASSPVTVIADPNECSFQLKLTGTETFTTSCDIAKSALVARSVNYDNQAAPKGTVAQVKIGEQIDPGEHAELRLGARTGDHRAWVSGCGRHQQDQLPDDDTAAVDPGDLRHPGLCADRRVAGGTLPHPHSLQRPVAALSHRQRMVRRLPPRDRVRHRGSDRQHLLRSLVPDRDRMHESRRRLLLPAGDEGRRHHKILSGGRGGQIPCPPRTRSLLTWTRAGSQNPKPRRTYAAGASSCRVSQGGWEGRDTGRYLGKEFRETSTASPQKVGRASPSAAPSAAAKQAINWNKVPAYSGLGRVDGRRSLEG